MVLTFGYKAGWPDIIAISLYGTGGLEARLTRPCRFPDTRIKHRSCCSDLLYEVTMKLPEAPLTSPPSSTTPQTCELVSTRELVGEDRSTIPVPPWVCAMFVTLTLLLLASDVSGFCCPVAQADRARTATVCAWRVALEARGLGTVSINVRITAVRKL